jgi:hypothetical protein
MDTEPPSPLLPAFFGVLLLACAAALLALAAFIVRDDVALALVPAVPGAAIGMYGADLVARARNPVPPARIFDGTRGTVRLVAGFAFVTLVVIAGGGAVLSHDVHVGPRGVGGLAAFGVAWLFFAGALLRKLRSRA